MTRCRYTAAATADIEAILLETNWRFGPAQMARYAALIDRAAGLAAAGPAPAVAEDVGFMRRVEARMAMATVGGQLAETQGIELAPRDVPACCAVLFE